MKPTIEFVEETYSLRKDCRNISRIFSYGRPAGSANETYYVEGDGGSLYSHETARLSNTVFNIESGNIFIGIIKSEFTFF